MLAFGEKVRAYTAGIDLDTFIADSLVYDATLRNLELIGEAATHVPEEVRAAHPEIPGGWWSPCETGSSTPILGSTTRRCGA